jgi:hypothetical protein
MYPISAEQGFTCQADIKQMPVFQTPAGRLAPIVGIRKPMKTSQVKPI